MNKNSVKIQIAKQLPITPGSKILIDDHSVAIHEAIMCGGVTTIRGYLGNKNQMNIDNLATQTPEEKEELDLIDTTPHQYEMSKFSGNEWNGEGLPPVGIECEFVGVNEDSTHKVEIYHTDDNKVMFLGRIESYPKESTIKHFKDGRDLMVFYTREGDRVFRKPETPQQREERERLEAAYDLYVTAQKAVNNVKIVTYELFTFAETINLIYWLAVVDKTNYRKESN